MNGASWKIFILEKVDVNSEAVAQSTYTAGLKESGDVTSRVTVEYFLRFTILWVW